MDNVLFQHNDARAACRARRVVAGVLLAQQVLPSEIGGMAAENDAVFGFARPDCKGLEELILHDDLTRATLAVAPYPTDFWREGFLERCRGCHRERSEGSLRLPSSQTLRCAQGDRPDLHMSAYPIRFASLPLLKLVEVPHFLSC